MSSSRSRPGQDWRVADQLARAVLAGDLPEARRLATRHEQRVAEREQTAARSSSLKPNAPRAR
jgi:hypothetical protein